MSAQAYAPSALPVRDDLAVAHAGFWEGLARPGSWWTGAERVAIAAEVRNARRCPLCRERRSALSPYAVDGEHRSEGLLPGPAVDAIHRVTSDPARLSRTWFEKLQANGLAEGPYVELLGIVVAVVSIDSFCRGIGASLHALPDPKPGAPTRYRPANVEVGTGWVAMIPNGQARGPEEGLFGPGGRTGNVIRAMSQVPDAVRDLVSLSRAHYLSPEEMTDLTAGRAIDRAQIELVAGRVSALRECFY